MKKILFGFLALALLAGCTAYKYDKKTAESFNIASYNIRGPFDKGDNHWEVQEEAA